MENTITLRKTNTKNIVMTGMLGALSTILMLLEISVPFAPTFVKFDFSELPVIIGGFLMGPVYGVMVAAIKILLNFVFNGTTTAGIGELANFLGSVLTLIHNIHNRHGKSIVACYGAEVCQRVCRGSCCKKLFPKVRIFSGFFK